MNWCTACKQDFGSVAAFDKHRVGTHRYTYSEGCKMDPIVEDGRRCLSVEEMKEKGFVSNALGRWSWGRDLERARDRLSVGLHTSEST